MVEIRFQRERTATYESGVYFEDPVEISNAA